MSAFQGGFTDPVQQSQAAFRAVMGAMARPGRIAQVGDGLTPLASLSPATAAVLLTLCDPDTPVWFDESGHDLAEWLRFHSGAVVTNNRATAAIALLPSGGDALGWNAFATGTPADPHLSATLILPVTALEGGEALALRGPGIDGVTIMAPQGLPAGFPAAMQANAALFPMGFDVILTCGACLLALPRTTRITEG